MALFSTLCVSCILITYILLVTAEGETHLPLPAFPGTGGAVTDPRKQPSQDTVIRCDDIQETTCKSMLIHQTMMMMYKDCTRSSGSAQVTLHCCVPGVGSFDGCLSQLEQARNCTSTGWIPSLVCELKHDGQAVMTTTTQTVRSNNDVSDTTQQPEAPGRNSPSRKKEESASIPGVIIGLIVGLVGAIVVAVVVVLVVVRVCRQKRTVTEDAEKTIPGGVGSKEWEAAKSNPYGDIGGDDGYMDIKALDFPKDKPQDN